MEKYTAVDMYRACIASIVMTTENLMSVSADLRDFMMFIPLSGFDLKVFHKIQEWEYFKSVFGEIGYTFIDISDDNIVDDKDEYCIAVCDTNKTAQIVKVKEIGFPEGFDHE